MESFSKKVKDQLAAAEPKKKCCRFTDDAMEALVSRKREDIGEELRQVYEKSRCDNCRITFLRRLFRMYGAVTDPEKSYHLDFTFGESGCCDEAEEILADLGFDFRRTMRRDKHVLYIKDSSAIEEFLVMIGASAAAFELMNEKIMRDFRNSVNRQVNCDTANIEKQLSAGKKYVDAIAKLMESGRIEALPEDLRLTARLRYENEQMILTELGNLHNPPVSKSGIRHRLERILRLSEELLKEQES